MAESECGSGVGEYQFGKRGAWHCRFDDLWQSGRRPDDRRNRGAGVLWWLRNFPCNKGVDFQNGGFIDNNGGNNVMTGAMTLEPGYCDFEINGGALTVSNVLSGSGVFYVQGGTGP